MANCGSYVDTMVATPQVANYSDGARCVLAQARDAAWDALADLAQADLSRDASDLRQRPEYWVGHLQYLLGYLLIAVEQSES
jgi:hypothetical protein